MKISLCMIARDEARHLPRCLASVAGVVDEIVLVDTGSSDATVEIARAAGASVYHEAWRDDFSHARNASLARAGGDWILVLDADEALDPSAAAGLRAFLEGTRADGVLMILRNLQPEGEVCRYQDLRLTRLFRNRPAYRYEQPIHEQIRPAIVRAGGTLVASPLVLLHYGYAEPTVQGGRLRVRRNLALLEAAVAASPEDPYLHYQLGLTCKAAGDDARARHHLHRALALDDATLHEEVRTTLFTKLAQLALAAGRYDEAGTWAERSLALAPGHVVALYVAALSHLFLGRILEAHPLLVRARQAPSCSPTGRAQLDQVLRFCEAHLATPEAV